MHYSYSSPQAFRNIKDISDRDISRGIMANPSIVGPSPPSSLHKTPSHIQRACAPPRVSFTPPASFGPPNGITTASPKTRASSVPSHRPPRTSTRRKKSAPYTRPSPTHYTRMSNTPSRPSAAPRRSSSSMSRAVDTIFLRLRFRLRLSRIEEEEEHSPSNAEPIPMWYGMPWVTASAITSSTPPPPYQRIPSHPPSYSRITRARRGRDNRER